MRLTQCSKPLVLRCRPEQQRIRTEVTDADTTVFVSIGAASLHLAAPCGNQQPIRVISSSVYAMHAVYAIDAVQQAAGAPVSP